MLVCILTVVAVSDAVLQHGVPLLLLLLRHHTEVVVAGVRMPQDERELGRTLDKWTAAHFALDTYNQSHDRTSLRNFSPFQVFIFD